jgi:hypothetical protein
MNRNLRICIHLKICPKYEICKNMHIQTETNESLFNDSYRFLKFHMISESKKNMLFHFLHKLLIIMLFKINKFCFKQISHNQGQ